MPDVKVPELKILPIAGLYPHEELNASALLKIKSSMKLGTFTNPIIVDKNTHVILDGMHRFQLLKDLDYKFIPCQLVDYLSEEIEVRGWFPTIYMRGGLDDGIQNIRSFVSAFCKREGMEIESYTSAGSAWKQALDSSRPCLWSIVFPEMANEKHMVLRIRNESHELHEITEMLNRFIGKLEVYLKLKRIGVLRFNPDDNAKHSVDTREEIIDGGNQYRAVCTMPRTMIRKDEVIDWALKRKLFPKKATRHVIKTCRALYINIPFSILKGKISEERANLEMNKLLSDSKHIKRLYMEPVMIYDELMYELTKKKK